MAFFQKVRFVFQKSKKKKIPENYPELEQMAGNLNFKLDSFWNIFLGDLKHESHFPKKATFKYVTSSRIKLRVFLQLFVAYFVALGAMSELKAR